MTEITKLHFTIKKIHAIKRGDKTVDIRFRQPYLQQGNIVTCFDKDIEDPMSLDNTARVRIISIHQKRLNLVTENDVRMEGFQYITKEEFISMFCKDNHVLENYLIDRIEFEYVGE